MKQNLNALNAALWSACHTGNRAYRGTAARRAAGWNNAAQDSLSKTEWQIVRDNVFTFFNFVFVALAACLFAVAHTATWCFGHCGRQCVHRHCAGAARQTHAGQVTLLSVSTACVVRGGRTRTVPQTSWYWTTLCCCGRAARCARRRC
ncbi:MAG: hypothetical protein ACLR7U_08135 [Ruthenibacterium lactatiformans]